MPVQLEPENWTDLLQAVTFMVNPDADPNDPLAWTTAHESRLELWADTLQRCAQALEQGITGGRFVSETGREIEVYVTDIIRAVGGNLERMAQLARPGPAADWEPES
ncbi:MAG: hypothetical protein M3P51_10510 [Chloroflexota bacterium]|nr:hypothetical protein [Chloroflexota bacterium]